MNQSLAKQTPHLVRYDAACKALAEARAVDEVQDIRNKAEAMRVYGMQAKNKTLEVDAAEIRIRAERKLGELIAEQKRGAGLAKPGPKSVPTGNRIPTLAEAGIDKKLSSRAQKMAAVPADEFEAEVGEWRQRVQAENARVTTRLEKAAERAAVKQPEPQADDGPTLSELVDELQRENETLRKQLEAIQSELPDADLRQQLARSVQLASHARREQGIAMDRAAQSQKREEFVVRMLRACGKAAGLADPNHTDPRDIVKAVQAMAKAVRRAA
jgi:hypothetical protein